VDQSRHSGDLRPKRSAALPTVHFEALRIGWPPNLAKAHAAILQVDVAVSFGGTDGDHARSVGKRLAARPVAFGGRRDPAVGADAHGCTRGAALERALGQIGEMASLEHLDLGGPSAELR
jgi:hypothetical protein